MRVTYLLLLVMVSLTWYSCEKKSALMVDSLTAEPVVNPYLKSFLKTNMLVTMQMDATNTISGLGDKDAIRTSNAFESFETNPYGTTHAVSLPRINKNLFAYMIPYSIPLTLNCSSDYGKTWKTFAPDLGSSPYGVEAYMVADMQYLASDRLYLVAGSKTEPIVGPTIFRTLLYKVNPTTGKGDLLSSLDGYYPKQVYFLNNTTGWLVLNKFFQLNYNYYEAQNTYIARTTDGGLTWSAPVMVNSTTKFSLAVGDAQRLFLYCGPSNADSYGYFSADGGLTWKPSDRRDYYQSVCYAGPKVMYALFYGGFAKSEDNGATWQTVQDINSLNGVSNLSFIDEKQGIAYSVRDKKLCITTDGGLHWKLLMFPFPYIME